MALQFDDPDFPSEYFTCFCHKNKYFCKYTEKKIPKQIYFGKIFCYVNSSYFYYALLPQAGQNLYSAFCLVPQFGQYLLIFKSSTVLTFCEIGNNLYSTVWNAH